MELKLLLSASLVSASLLASAQADRAFAITGNGNHDFTWVNIREVNLADGKIVKDLSVSNAMVAAIAFDKVSEKLFYIPMRTGELRWANMNTKGGKVEFNSMVIPGYVASNPAEENNNVTRMAIGADRMGYAISNDGNHVYQFSLGKNPSVRDLGALIDAEGQGISVHNKCSSWGGDMIADAFGQLILISASRNVFEIDPATLVTKHRGTITGLPANFTANGAAVDSKGQVVLTSAVAFDGYYRMDMEKLAAVRMEGSDKIYSASDLAGSNMLRAAEYARTNKFVSAPIVTKGQTGTSIYPNPVQTNSFSIALGREFNGTYQVVLSDLSGRAIQTNRVGLMKGQQNYQFNMQNRPAKGTYLVKVIGDNNEVLFSDKVVVL